MADNIQATLCIKDIQGMSNPQFKVFIEWLHSIADELEKEDRAIFSKNPRFTLYKSN